MLESFDVNLAWGPKETRVFLPIIFALFFFVVYWFTAQSGKIKALFYKNNTEDDASVKHIFFTKYFGFISMGVVPAVLCLIFIPGLSIGDYGLAIVPETSLFSLVWIVGLCLLVAEVVICLKDIHL